MKSAFVIFLALTAFSVFSQIPTNANRTDAKGWRQGKWTILFNEKWELLSAKNAGDCAYYRIINYKDNKPIGIVRDYYKSGVLQMEASFISDRPKEILDDSQPSHFYSETGQEVMAGAGGHVPLNPNLKDDRGLRQGWWTIELDGNMNKALNKNDIAFYRVMLFKDDQPAGVTKDYYSSGALYQEMTLKSFVEGKREYIMVVDYDQPYKVYWPDGSENLIAPNRIQYENLLNKGKYELALPYAEKALLATEKRLGKKDWRYQYFLIQLAQTHSKLGNYTKAETLYTEAIHMDEDGKLFSYTAMAMRSLANLYDWMGNTSRIEPLLNRALIIIEREFGKESSNYGSLLNEMGNMYSGNDQHKAEAAYLEALKIKKDQFGKAVNMNSVILANLAGVYMEEGKLTQAKPLLDQAIEITEKEKGRESYFFAWTIESLATFYKLTGHYEKADSLYQQALHVYETSVGKSNLSYLSAETNLAKLHLIRQEYDQAEALFLQIKESYLAKIENLFPMLSEYEKDAFYESISSNFSLFNSFCLLQKNKNPHILGDMYNNQLATKAILLNSASKWKQRIRNSGDKKLFSLYSDWESNQGLLARWYKQTDGRQNKHKADSLENLTNIQEKELSRRSEMFASLADKKRISWEEVKSKLKPNEVAIEMIRIKKFGILKSIVDSSDAKLHRYPQFGLTDTTYYAALLITSESEMPELVFYPNGNELENRYLKKYSNSIKTQTEDTESYDQFWKPIATKLNKLFKKKTHTFHVYFSSDGVFNQINLNTLLNPKTHRYVLDETNITLVTNTKDLLLARKEEVYNNLAYLFGYPDYGTKAEDRIALAKKERQSQPVYYALTLERGSNDLSELPGTKTEVENIASLMLAKGWEPQVLTGDKALEETLKDCFKPRVLHIATHGYFQADASQTKNPLLRSGLMLTGAAQTLAGNKDDTTEDGILTAYEAMNLNLDNTDLVVLSACETGLGTIKNGEGVYGLQRAFKVAGANAIIMSLWKVDDEATQALMTEFYAQWLKTGNKHQAFETAQQNIKSKMKSPYYWGAFVLVGE
ncbi:MAG: CHAT domain-containing protein [Bacteroidetes bacterium]|nr:CHAT domain-containing protein [Bacteroidota bacterium]